MTTSSLVSTAAAAAAVIPFHCVICFEEFNLTLRYPVVLPCSAGHTYVCCVCAKRLTSCFECREKFPTRGGGGPPLYPQRRYQALSSPATPKTAVASSCQPEHTALHFPKNIVLISMMEAAQRQASEEVASQKNDDPETNSEGMENSSTDDNDGDEFSTNHIISGLATYAGPCGTYAVRDPDGLTVLAKAPNTSPQNKNDDPGNSYVSEESDANPTDVNQTDGETEDVDDDDGFHLSKGQTLQIVSFSGDVAKLARGEGFIVANSSQLVKVGAPLDTCCRLEGMIETLVLRGRDLQNALTENQKLEQELRDRVAGERSSTPVHATIAEAPKQCEFVARSSDGDIMGKEYKLLVPNSPRDVYVTEASDSSGLELVGENTMRLYAESTSRMPSSPSSIDNSDFHRFDTQPPGIPRYRRNSDDDLNELAYGCGSALFGKAFLNFDMPGEQGCGSFDSLDGSGQPDSQGRLLADSAPRASHDGPLTPPARNPPNQNYVSNLMSAATPILSSSFDAVDWRTGMSGHRALSKSSPRSGSVSRSVRMMSEHRGVGAVRPAAGRSPSSSPASVPRVIAGVEYEDYLHPGDKF